jgi:hypothetical protein
MRAFAACALFVCEWAAISRAWPEGTLPACYPLRVIFVCAACKIFRFSVNRPKHFAGFENFQASLTAILIENNRQIKMRSVSFYPPAESLFQMADAFFVSP